MSQPDYLSLSPPSDKEPADYTWAERRAEIADAIERKGHYRLLERSQQQMGDQYGVSQNQIKEDIQRINEQRGEQLGKRADGELDTLHTRAVEDLLDENDSEAAYYLMRKHYETLMDAAAAGQGKDPDKTEVTGADGGPLTVNINDTIIDSAVDDTDTDTNTDDE